MHEKVSIKIEIENGEVSFHTNASIVEANFWLDHIKHLIHSGQLEDPVE